MRYGQKKTPPIAVGSAWSIKTLSYNTPKSFAQKGEMELLAHLIRPIAKALVSELREDPEFAELLAEIVTGQPAVPALVNAKTLAERLGVSASLITQLKREGLPRLIVGQEARYNVDAVLAWLENRQEKDGAA